MNLVGRDTCFYCEIPFGTIVHGCSKPIFKTTDHIVPISKGGGNSIFNLADACSHCNPYKSNHTLEEFISFLIFRIDEINWRTRDGIRANKGKFTIDRLTTMLQNTGNLVKHVEPFREKLYSSYKSEAQEKRPKRSAEKRLKKKAIREIGFFDNPVLMTNAVMKVTKSKQDKELQEFLQHQTIEQFQLAKKHGWRFAKMMTEPEHNFHYE